MKSQKAFDSIEEKNSEESVLEQRIENSIRLHKAIDNNDIVKIEEILAEGNVDVHYEYSGILDINISPLCKLNMLCRKVETISEHDALKIMQTLINYGADVNKEWSGMSPLFCAIGMEPKPLLIKCLLDAGADVNLGRYATPLGIGIPEIDKILLAYGANIHNKDAESESSHFDRLKNKIENPGHAYDRETYDTIYKPSYILYTIAAFIDDLFNRANKDVIQQSLNIALKLIGQLSDDHIDFMLCRFKSLCAMKNAKLTGEESSDFAEHLKQTINYDFLPEKIKIGLQDILEDYEEVIDNIKSFALWDAYNIYIDEESIKHANENEVQPITAPINFKQAQAILINDNPKDLEIFQHISGFCEQHPIYKGHSYLKDESSKNEITRIMLEHLDCASKVKELFIKYKGIFYSEIIEQAIDDYEHTQSLAGNTNLSLGEEF